MYVRKEEEGRSLRRQRGGGKGGERRKSSEGCLTYLWLLSDNDVQIDIGVNEVSILVPPHCPLIPMRQCT